MHGLVRVLLPALVIMASAIAAYAWPSAAWILGYLGGVGAMLATFWEEINRART